MLPRRRAGWPRRGWETSKSSFRRLGMHREHRQRALPGKGMALEKRAEALHEQLLPAQRITGVAVAVEGLDAPCSVEISKKRLFG